MGSVGTIQPGPQDGSESWVVEVTFVVERLLDATHIVVLVRPTGTNQSDPHVVECVGVGDIPRVDIKPAFLRRACRIQSMVFFITPDMVPWYSGEEENASHDSSIVEHFDVGMGPTAIFNGQRLCCEVPKRLSHPDSPAVGIFAIFNFVRPCIHQQTQIFGVGSAMAGRVILECKVPAYGQPKARLMHGTMLFLIQWNKMATSEESGAAAGDDHDLADEVVLSSVNQALEAVENEALQESTPAAEEPPQAPRNVIPNQG